MERGKKPIPRLLTDEDAAEFVEKANLAEYDLSVFRPAQFRMEKKKRRG